MNTPAPPPTKEELLEAGGGGAGKTTMVHIRYRYKRLRRPNPPGSVRAASCSQAEEPLLRLSQNIQPRQHH